MKILLIEDDIRIARPIQEDLLNQRYLVDTAADGEEAWARCLQEEYDLVLMDLMLPKLDGLALCNRLRASGFNGLIMMITARDTKQDKILGLDSGADDYLVKPFDLDELSARIRALLRRKSEPRQPILTLGQLKLDPSTCQVTYGGRPVSLTPTEYRLLLLFLRNPQRVFSKDELLDRLWSSDECPTEQVIKAHVKGLRTKLEAAGAARQVVQTVYGLGYRLGSVHD